jgi:hypothetical protein
MTPAAMLGLTEVRLKIRACPELGAVEIALSDRRCEDVLLIGREFALEVAEQIRAAAFAGDVFDLCGGRALIDSAVCVDCVEDGVLTLGPGGWRPVEKPSLLRRLAAVVAGLALALIARAADLSGRRP